MRVFSISALPPSVLQNFLPHCDSAIIESDRTSRRINIARFRLISNLMLRALPPSNTSAVIAGLPASGQKRISRKVILQLNDIDVTKVD